MALDGAFLYAVKKELEILNGSRVDKIYQPSKEEIIISFRTREGSKKLLLCVSADNARVHITEADIDNPKTPPMFCMLMRKLFCGGKLMNIRQLGLERILYFDFECTNELSDKVTITLACEIMGRRSNLVAINENGRIIDSIKRVNEEMSSQRPVLPGMVYELPPESGRLCFLDADSENIRNTINSVGDMELSKAIVKTMEGISPLLAREWVFYVARGRDVNVSDMDDELFSRLIFTMNQTKAMLTGNNCNFTVIKTKEGAFKDFCFMNVTQYGNLMVTYEMKSAFETLDLFYTERDRQQRLKQRANDLFRLLINTNERIVKRIASQKDELSRAEDKDEYKLCGDLLSANIYRLEKGMESIKLENFYAEDCPQIMIKLDKRLSPAQNAQKYYAEYRKAGTAEKKLAEQISLGEEEQAYIDSVFDALTRANSEDEITALRLELAEQGYIRSVKLKGTKMKQAAPYEFISSNGFTIYVGRNNVQNDKLTLKTARKTDIWLHTQDIPGSHVIIWADNKDVDDNTIYEAAMLAAFHSKAKNSSQVPVDYVAVKYVKKPNGAKPGKVIFTNNRTLYVAADEKLVENMRVK